MTTPINLDFASGTPVDDTVAQLVLDTMKSYSANPSALYVAGREAKLALETARASIARSLGCRPSEILLTSGGTESTNLAIQGIMRAFPEGHLLISSIEHDAVYQPAQLFRHDVISVDQKGIVQLNDLQEKIQDDTVLISVMYANNEIGTIQPIKEIASLVKKVRRERQQQGNTTPLYLHTDACQAGQFLECNPSKLGVDLLTINGGKLYGPKQSGLLYVRAGTVIKPLIMGGGQEFGLRSGTEHVAMAAGFALALEQAFVHRHEVAQHTLELSHYFIDELTKRFSSQLNGHKKLRLPNNIHVTFEGKDNERVLFALDQLGVQASAGSACQASKDTPSRVLQAIGLTEVEAQSSIRFSLGKTTTKAELDQALSRLKQALEM